MLYEKIRRARLELGMTQADLAGDGFSRSFVAAVETGRINPSAENLRIMADRLRKPVSYFLPTELEDVMSKLVLNLKAAKALLEVGDLRGAEDALQKCETYKEYMGREEKAMYHQAIGQMEHCKGNTLRAVTEYMASAHEYLGIGETKRAWFCYYTAAHILQSEGHVGHSLELARSAYTVIQSTPGYYSERAYSAYLIGTLYHALGMPAQAMAHFEVAMGESAETAWDIHINSQLGKASCAMVRGEWKEALLLSSSAAELAEQKQLTRIVAECMIYSVISLARLELHEKANATFWSLLLHPGVTTDMRIKAFREYLNALCDLKSARLAGELKERFHTLLEASNESDEWKRLKNQWVLAKCALIEGPADITCIINEYVERFSELGRYRDAAEASRFGAELLENEGHYDVALGLMKQAFALHMRAN